MSPSVFTDTSLRVLDARTRAQFDQVVLPDPLVSFMTNAIADCVEGARRSNPSGDLGDHVDAAEQLVLCLRTLSALERDVFVQRLGRAIAEGFGVSQELAG